MFSLKLLGGALLEGVDGPVRGRAGQRRRIALLALLAAARGRPVARERLVGWLWPEHPGDAARHLLSESLYVLRRALGDGSLVATGGEVALDPRVVESDVEAFRAALEKGDPADAVALYRGAFMDGFYLNDAGEFERWVEGERDRLARLYAQALESLAEAAEAEEDFQKAVEWWRRLSTSDPYSSRVVLRLMHALESAGEHTAALRTAAEHADFLRADLDAEPDPAVPAYADRLRTSPPAGRIPPAPAQAREPELPPAARNAWTEAEPTTEAVCSHESPSAAVPVPQRDGTTPPPAPLPPAPKRLRRRVGAAVAILLVMVVVAVSVARRAHRAGPAAKGRPALDPRRMAVLYFDDHSERHDLSHIANGLTEELIHRLAQVSVLDVISRNGVKPFRDGRASLDSIATVLRVGTLVEGSVQRSGNRLRVTVQLVDAASGAHLQSRTLERPMGELFSLEKELANDVAEFLRRRLGQEIRLRERTAGTRSVAAREAVLRAGELREEALRVPNGPSPLSDGTPRRILERADSLLAEAARADRRWAEPWILRGWVAAEAGELAPSPERDAAYKAALGHATRALELRPGDPGALELRGTVRWRIVQAGARSLGRKSESDTLSAAAREDLNEALERDPSRAKAWSTLSQLLRVQEGRLAEAEVAARRALEEDEFLEDAPLIMERLYRSSVQLARYDSAAAWCSRGRERFPNHWRFVECRLTLLGYPGPEPANVALAWRLFRELEQMDPAEAARGAGRGYWRTYRRMAVARVAARAGLADSARALCFVARAEVRGDRELEGAQAGDEAYVRLLLGERDSALVLLKRHLEVQPRLHAQIARDVKFRPLRSDPRFRRLVDEAPEDRR
jgi:DNA-binding SARP family transcriptional activator/TolB-like protein